MSISPQASLTRSPFIAPHFRAHELWCPCCGVLRLDYKLLGGLELLRKYLNEELDIPLGEPSAGLSVSSGYRCQVHNAKVGGTLASQHLAGCAADVYWKGDVFVLYNAALKVDAFHKGGIGLDKQRNFLHVDCRSGGSKRWGYKNRRIVELSEVLT